MNEKDFKKLLIDLETSLAEIGRGVGISKWAVQKYFRDELRNPGRRAQIRAFLARRAARLNQTLPEFWTDSKAA